MKSGKSENSINTVRSLKTDKNPIIPIPDIETSLPAACQKYGCSYTVFVKREYIQDDSLKKRRMSEAPVKYKKIAMAPNIAPSTMRIESLRKDVSKAPIFDLDMMLNDGSALQGTAIYDGQHRLVEFLLRKAKPLPHELIQIIRLLLPYYEYIRKITFFQCSIDDCGINEINKILSLTSITEISFDGSRFTKGDVSALLANKSATIKYLSMSGCQINDQTCNEIASRLHFTEDASKTMCVLNLSSNHITDEGASCLGEALRTNRRLRYLNLADNRIGDHGAIAILNSLTEFALKSDEIADKKIRHLEYLISKRELFFRMYFEYRRSRTELNTLNRVSKTEMRAKINRKKSSATSLKSKASLKKDVKKEIKSLNSSREDLRLERVAAELIGPFEDPYAKHHVTIRNDQSYCLGNFVLCYLNLSYNNLSYLSLKKLTNVMQYQKNLKLLNQSGLIRVLIEGNNLPTACTEYQIINDMTRIAKGVPFGDASGRRKSRARMSMAPSTGRN